MPFLVLSCSENRTKNFIDVPDKDQLTYTQHKIFHFDSSTSELGVAETDIICTINIPLVVRLKHTTYLRQGGLPRKFNDE